MPTRSSGANELEGIVPPRHVHLYLDGSAATLDLEVLKGYVSARLPGTEVDMRPGFFRHFSGMYDVEEMAGLLAWARVKDVAKRTQDFEPLYGEVQVEARLLREGRELQGLLYDAHALHDVYGGIIPGGERGPDHAHIILCDRLFGTFDPNDLRWHARVILCGFPSMISTSGVVEAPARPREFYLLKRKYAAMGMDGVPVERIKAEFKGLFIDYDDERLTEVLKGYVFQALFYHMTSEPFCDDANCRLFNAHWQSELLRAQLDAPYEFCRRHEAVLDAAGATYGENNK